MSTLKIHFHDETRWPDGPLCGFDPRYADTTNEAECVTCTRCLKALEKKASIERTRQAIAEAEKAIMKEAQ